MRRKVSLISRLSSSTASGPPSPLGKAYGIIVSNKRDAKDVVPYKMGANFYVLSEGADSISALLGPSGTPVPTRFVVNFDVLSVGEAFRLPFFM